MAVSNEGLCLERFVHRLPSPNRSQRSSREASASGKVGGFDDIPLRRADAVKSPFGCNMVAEVPVSVPKGSEGLQQSYKNGLLVLAQQFSPPKALTVGAYKWSILRFLILTSGTDALTERGWGPAVHTAPELQGPAHFFDVKVPEVDVGRSGPFSSLSVNAAGTHVCVVSSRHPHLVVCQIPDFTEVSPPDVRAAQVHTLPGSITSFEWHPVFPSILVVAIDYEHVFVVDTAFVLAKGQVSEPLPLLNEVSNSGGRPSTTVSTVPAAEPSIPTDEISVPRTAEHAGDHSPITQLTFFPEDVTKATTVFWKRSVMARPGCCAAPSHLALLVLRLSGAVELLLARYVETPVAMVTTTEEGSLDAIPEGVGGGLKKLCDGVGRVSPNAMQTQRTPPSSREEVPSCTSDVVPAIAVSTDRHAFYRVLKRFRLIEGTTERDYSACAILRSQLVLLIARLAHDGRLETFGLDTDFEWIQRQLVLLPNEEAASFPNGFDASSLTGSVHSMLLDTVHIPVATWGCLPRLLVGPMSPRDPLRGVGDEVNVGHVVPHFCPFALVTTPEEVFLVEFPWVMQIEKMSVTVLGTPSLLPTHIQRLFLASGPGLPRSTCLPQISDHESDDRLFLGVALVSGNATLPLYVLRCALQTPPALPATSSTGGAGTPTRDASSSSFENTLGWSTCDMWTLLSSTLLPVMASKQTLQRYQKIMKDAWNLLVPVSSESDTESYGTKNRGNLVAKCEDRIKTFAIEFKEFSTAAGQGETPDLTDVPRHITFQITEKEPIERFLEQLGMSSLKLCRLSHAREQLGHIKENLKDLEPRAILRKIEAQQKLLSEESRRIERRLEAINASHEALLLAVRKCLIEKLLPRFFHAQKKTIACHILRLLREAPFHLAGFMSAVLKQNLDGTTERLVEQWLLQSAVSATQNGRATQYSATGIRTELLRKRVRWMLDDLVEVFETHATLVREMSCEVDATQLLATPAKPIEKKRDNQSAVA